MEKKYFKYNADDILEIIMETLAVKSGFETFSSAGNLVNDNGKISFIGVIGELEDDEVDKIDLEKLYSEMDYNGTHPEEMGFSSTKRLLQALEKSIETRDF